jgi:NYN domain-containing protein
MKRESQGPMLTTVFVDYDNVYLSLKRKSEEAAKRFSKDAGRWIKEIESGRLMASTNTPAESGPRRITINRCYGNPVPRRNQNDNSTDMSSFPFVRHHFLRAGFEVIDCPPLTAQLKNSADIRMVMDVRDILTHDTYFDEFVIMSGDADFTPLLHRLRSHARRAVIYSNDNTAAPYTALCDAEIRESDFLALLLENKLPETAAIEDGTVQHAEVDTQRNETQALPHASAIASLRKEILAEVVAAVRAADQPLPLEALADRAVRTLGYDKTVGSAWGGVGSFRDLLAKGLPEDIRLNGQPPYCVYDATRAIQHQPAEARSIEERPMEARRPEPKQPEPAQAPQFERTLPPLFGGGNPQPAQQAPAAHSGPPAQAQRGPLPPAQAEALSGQPPGMQYGQQPYAPAPRPGEGATLIQQSIARIHEASQAPTLSPPDYRALFDLMSQEIAANGPAGSQTLVNIVNRAQELGIDIRRDDVRFVLDVVGEGDPWFSQGVSASLFASRFRNFVVARCRGQGLNLSADELDLIEAWFAAPVAPQRTAASAAAPAYAPAAAAGGGMPAHPQAAQQQPGQPHAPAPNQELRAERWWNLDDQRGQPQQPAGEGYGNNEEFPRIIRTRLRG